MILSTESAPIPESASKLHSLFYADVVYSFVQKTCWLLVSFNRCDTGWTGELCDRCMTYPGCVHGTCSRPWQCHCQGHWAGTFCDLGEHMFSFFLLSFVFIVCKWKMYSNYCERNKTLYQVLSSTFMSSLFLFLPPPFLTAILYLSTRHFISSSHFIFQLDSHYWRNVGGKRKLNDFISKLKEKLKK